MHLTPFISTLPFCGRTCVLTCDVSKTVNSNSILCSVVHSNVARVCNGAQKWCIAVIVVPARVCNGTQKWCIAVIVVPYIIMVHKGTSSSYR